MARGEAHIARRSYAHSTSGSCGSWCNSSLSVLIHCAAHAATNCGWPTRVPSTTSPRSASGLSPRHTSVPSSATPGGGGPPAQLYTRVQIGLHCSSTGLSTRFPCCICKAESRLAAEGRPGYRLAEACKRTPFRLVFVRSSETKCRPLLNLRRDNVYMAV